MEIVLASTSPWRIQMLAAAGVRCTGHAPPVDEAGIVHPDPVEMARLRAIAKATSVSALRPDAAVIGADQVCWMEAPPTPTLPHEAGRGPEIRVFHKPADAADHLAQLRALCGRTHTLSTAACVVAGGRLYEVVEHSRVALRAVADEELSGYVASGEGRACAGGYQVEGAGAWLIERIEGDWFNVVGLPLFPLLSLLRRVGARPPYVGLDTPLAPSPQIA